MNPFTAEFIPGSPTGPDAVGFQQHLTNAGRGATRPTINVAHGARVSEPRRVFITNLSAKVTNSDMAELMRARVGRPTNVHCGQNQKKTYATVEFALAEEAQRAIERLNGHVFKGWKMTVRYDKNQNFEQRQSARPAQHGRAPLSNRFTSEPPVIVDGSKAQKK